MDNREGIQPVPTLDRCAEAADHNRYYSVLRSIYAEIFELDFNNDTCSLVCKSDGAFAPPPPGLPLGLTISRVAREHIHPDENTAFSQLLNPVGLRSAGLAERESLSLDVRKLCLDGSYRWARLTLFALPGPDDGPRYMLCVQDVEEQKRASGLISENALLQRQRLDNLRYKAVLDHTKTMVFEWRDGKPSHMSSRIPEFLSGTYDGRCLFDIWRQDGVIYPGDHAPFEACLMAMANGAQSGEMTVRLRRRSGSFIWCKITYTCLTDPELGMRYIGTLRDVDSVTRAEQSLRFRAEYDPLTGAYNMQTFFEKAGTLIRDHEDQPFHLVRFDVGGFKAINEMFGLEEGDRLLRALAHLVRERLDKEQEVFARLSGDIFAVCLMGGRERVRNFIHWLSTQAEEYTQAYRVKLFFGICPVDKRKTPVHVLCDWAYLALKTVKGNDLINHAYYDGELRQRLLDENYITDQMHEALEKGQFVLYLQPKVEISSGRIVGAEALARWDHPQDGLIPPDRFIPLFERNGFIIRFDEYIWELACRLLRHWLDKGYRPTPVSVNVSRMHFNDEDFWRKLICLTDKYRLPRHLLELELTESAFFESEKILSRVMNELQKVGFVFSMDDFGTGYSSLSTLRDLPFNIVKLDRSFISDGTDNARGQIVARNTVTMARQLNMSIIAEGVETLDQALFLLNIGCNTAQGYYYARPVDAEEFEVLSFVQEKAFNVDSRLRDVAREQGLPMSLPQPCYE